MSITTRVPYGFETEAMPLEAFGGVGGHRLKPIPGSLQLHGGGFKKAIVPVLAITAAVVAPIAVPALAGAIGASAGLSVATSYAAAGALYGATAGALTSAIGGGNIAQGALIGGALGGAGGYLSAPADVAGAAATGATAGGTAGAGTTGAVSGAGAAAPTTTTGAGLSGAGSSIMGVPDASNVSTILSGGPATTPFGVTPVDAAGNVGVQLSGTTAAGGVGGAGSSIMAPPGTSSVGTILGTTPVTPPLGITPVGAPATGTPAAGQEKGFLSELGTELKNRVTDPKMAAELVLRGATQLAGGAMVGSGLSDEQQQLVNMQAAELDQLRRTNEAAYKQRLEAASALLGDVNYFDPEYFGLQRARQQQIAGGQAKRAGLRGLTGEQRRAEARRYDIATARDVGTAYDQGYLTGVQGRLQTQQAGLAQLPMPSQYTATSYGNLQNLLAQGERQRMEQAQATGELFGGLTGYSASQSKG